MATACFWAMDRPYLIGAFNSTLDLGFETQKRLHDSILMPVYDTYTSLATSLILFVPGTWLTRLQ